MFCRYCGNEMPDDTKFCSNCGAAVDVGQQEQRILTTPHQVEGKKAELDNESKTSNPAKMFSRILIVCIIAIVCVAVGGAVLGSSGNKTVPDVDKNDIASATPTHDTTKTEPNSDSDSSKDSKAEVTYEELVGNYTDGPANDITSSGISIDIYDTVLEIFYGSYRGGSGTFDVVFESKDKWPKIENNSIQFTAEEEFWDCTYQLTLTFVPASESPSGSDTIYLKGSELFEDCVFVRDSGDYSEYDQYENDDYSYPEDNSSAWDNVPDSDRISDNVEYFDWHKPFGYFLGLNTYLEIESAMSILYDAELGKIQLSFYDAESAQYGYDMGFPFVEPVAIAYIDPIVFPDNEWITFHPEGEDSDVTAKFKIYVWHSVAANDPNDNRGDHIDIEIEDYGNHPNGSIYLSMAFNTYYHYYGDWNSTHTYPY